MAGLLDFHKRRGALQRLGELPRAFGQRRTDAGQNAQRQNEYNRCWLHP
jgi:hypothetical protein